MRDAQGPQFPPLPTDAHLLQPLLRWAASEPDRVLAARPGPDGMVEVTAREFRDRVWALAKGFIAAGVEPGDRVALMAHTRLEWTEVDSAILAAGGVTVPIYDTSSLEQLQWIVEDSEAVLLVLETPAMREMYERIAALVAVREPAFVIDEGGLDALVARGAGLADDVVDQRVAALTTDTLATIIYTSGTTGRSKGCILTHGNLRTNVLQSLDAVRAMLTDDETSLLFLPLAHAMSKTVALVGLEYGVKGVFATDMAHLAEELPLAEPTMVVAVPRVFEKVFNGAQHKAQADGKGAIFDRAADTAIRWSEQRTNGHAHAGTAVTHALFDHLVYGKIRAVFGGHLRFAISGGGPLGERLTHFFNGIGVKIFEGYGLTETSPTLTINRADAWKPGTVGTPLAGTAIRIADDGEILAKGPQIFQGYWHNDAATAEVFDEDGWFRTGDIGELDDDGYLRITGRKKELIVTAAGKNVAPAPLEDRLRAHPLVSQAVVQGDNRPFVSVLLTLDEEAVKEWAGEHDLDGISIEQLATDDRLRAVLQEAIDDANESVSRAESIRAFAVLPHDLTIEAEELTPTLKVRRAMVEKHYASVIDGIYRS